MPLPAGRVKTWWTLAINDGRIEHFLYPLSQTVRRLPTINPQGLDRHQHILGCDLGDGALPQLRAVRFAESAFPLGAMLRVAPASLMQRDEGIGEGPKRHFTRLCSLGIGVPLLLGGDRVDAFREEAARIGRRFPSLREGNASWTGRPKTHFPLPPVTLVEKTHERAPVLVTLR